MLEDPPEGLVNFWTPTPWKIRLPIQTRWGFMLKSPIRQIGGFGSVVSYEEVTVTEAWRRWGLANGVRTSADFHSRIAGFAARRSSAPIDGDDPTIGCLLLDACVFLPPEDFQTPEEIGVSFPSQIVKWKGFEGDLRLKFEEAIPRADRPFRLVDPDAGSWEVTKRKKRLSQSLFRRDVLEAYGGICAATGTRFEQVLNAAHIQPFVNFASNHIQNGIPLRRDVHSLFDAGLITLREDYRFEVAPSLTAIPYRELDGSQMHLPKSSVATPSLEAIRFHRREVFRKFFETNHLSFRRHKIIREHLRNKIHPCRRSPASPTRSA
ncbi:HNH endonuclease [Sphingomicrobium clamense]|uniref:HNH endonuclease n=1 Tax=Sphingomicrobium clamense TaxID=2851013 RepID=A0ABS6V898_9SPHN|nr:HNH endonuclease [Sphingomicrobium sp. B8]MBW0145774.1 HNH endonuclease [Sphingomicrobium sp. B8]